MPKRVLGFGVVVGVAGMALGGAVLADANTGRALFAGYCMAAGGAIFLGYSLFSVFWWRRRLSSDDPDRAS